MAVRYTRITKKQISGQGEAVGYVLKVQVDGSLEFEPVVEFLNDIGDVNVPSPSEGDRIAFDSATSKWVSKKMVYDSGYRAYLLEE